MPFISNTDKERKEMLATIGVEKFDDLLVNIPRKFLQDKECCLEPAYSEMEITSKIAKLAAKNVSTFQANSFLGGGVYDHFIPAAVDHVILKPEFHSAYTPYQAEVSQGTLQYIYEYQTMICDLTGMEISNAGMYDGASAAAEAILMAARKTRLFKAVIAGTIHPWYKEVIKTYTEGIGVELIFISTKNGLVDLEELKKAVDDKTGCVLLQTPNFFGNIENAFAVEEITHSAKKALFITAVDPISLAVMNAPAEYRADIVVGEGQALGNAQNYGGPLFGFLATNLKLSRVMPGRIVGATLDADGKRSYALTLQAREQHIRRAKATSNICSNQALCNLAATAYMTLMGKEGLKEVAIQSTTKAHYLAEAIAEIDGFEMAFDAPFFKEFAVKTPLPAAEIISKLKSKNIFPGIDLETFGHENLLLIAVTEKKRKCDLDELVKSLQEVNDG
ncbi:MAG: aminomethyl-transferring glycine dehydrogenase subunit GcvPA [Candidatus Cloacimonetes bacterium]|nr:aminomethyl-transferring glycine dehydrogenase subunit GcvPA [Candidatus Cloacimonadota bacterium]MCF7813115.1 aminomethyl-transferring glycine dehydrogenase subunit GcvPA [Candidatus Cloacimonadota bacterium]MCF7867563.1 aminomethyl-transferring glycine dehydrogenase subunit GcvPA [Candidatus Cloacimonadota bacterium]MCF7883043.1 aminomethyl-transferring glycine dehydrogenase subunit GcvPA [Candidatus Cloacimonadota bacterium]